MGKWPGKVYAAVRRKKAPSLASYPHRDTRKLSSPQHAFAWSMIDFLVAKHHDKLGRLNRSLSARSTTAEALRQVLGWSISKFDDSWRRWALKAYGR